MWNYFQRGQPGFKKFKIVLEEAKIDILLSTMKSHTTWDIKNLFYRISPEWYQLAVEPSPDDMWRKLGLQDLHMNKRLDVNYIEAARIMKLKPIEMAENIKKY